jgi:hypothetical protein
MRGITFEVVTQTSCIFRLAMLPLLKRFMEVLLRNYLQRCRHFFPGVFDVLKSSSLQGALLLFENCRSHWQEKKTKQVLSTIVLMLDVITS